MHLLFDDVRDAVRSLRTQPKFLIIASLTLALGIGAVTAIFSVVNGVLLKPLPYPHADRLVNIWSTRPASVTTSFRCRPICSSFYQRDNQVFEDMALIQRRRANLTESGSPEVVDALVTTHSYFDTLGVGFARGRTYTADEDTAGGRRASSVISHRLWTRRYGADPGLVGRPVRIDGEPTQVVGIAPALDGSGRIAGLLAARALQRGQSADRQLRLERDRTAQARRARRTRRRRTSSRSSQRAMSDYIQSDNYRAFLTDGRYRPLVHAMKEDIIGGVREPLLILLGTVGMVLLVACGNVANLCLVRAEVAAARDRRPRRARRQPRRPRSQAARRGAACCPRSARCSASPSRPSALPVLLRLAPQTIPRLELVRVDGTVLLFAAGAAVLSALLFGLVPAIRYTRHGRARVAASRRPRRHRSSVAAAGPRSCWSSRRPRWRWCCSSARACWRAASRG